MKKLEFSPHELLIYMKAGDAIEAIAQRIFQLHNETNRKPEEVKPEVEEPISIDEACALLRISRVTLNNWRHQGLVTVHSMGRRKYLYKSQLLSELEQPKSHGGRSTRGTSKCNTTNGKAA